MLTPFERLSLLPPIEDHRDGMALSMTVGREVLKQRLPGHFRPNGRLNCEEVVAVDNEVGRHAQTLRLGPHPVNLAKSRIHLPGTLDKARNI